MVHDFAEDHGSDLRPGIGGAESASSLGHELFLPVPSHIAAPTGVDFRRPKGKAVGEDVARVIRGEEPNLIATAAELK